MVEQEGKSIGLVGINLKRTIAWWLVISAFSSLLKEEWNFIFELQFLKLLKIKASVHFQQKQTPEIAVSKITPKGLSPPMEMDPKDDRCCGGEKVSFPSIPPSNSLSSAVI